MPALQEWVLCVKIKFIMLYSLTISNIAILEMLNILVALRIWAKLWKNFAILIHHDNQAVVEVLNKGKTKDKKLAAISRNIFMTAAEFDIELKVQHVIGKDNPVADLLFRWHLTKNPEAKLQGLLKNFEKIKITNNFFDIGIFHKNMSS